MPPPIPFSSYHENGKTARERWVIKIEKKLGRPTDAPKSHRESFRLSEDDMTKIAFCMEQLHLSKTDVIRAGINELYNKLNK